MMNLRSGRASKGKTSDGLTTPTLPPREVVPDLDTPARASRMEEKQELQELNKRLQFYILRQREKDASQEGTLREVDAVRLQAQHKLESAAHSHESQIDTLQRKRAEQESKIDALQSEALRAAQLLRNIQLELEAEKKSRVNSERRAQELAGELQASSKRCSDLESDLEAARDELGLAQETSDNRSNEVHSNRRSVHSLQQQLATAESRLKTLEQEQAVALKTHSEEVSRLRSHVTQLSKKSSFSDEDYRKSLSHNLEKIFEERRAQYEREKEIGLAALKAHYDDKISGYRESLTEVGHDFEVARQENKNLRRDLAMVNTTTVELESQREAMIARIQALEEQLVEEKTRPELIIAEKNEIIRRIKAAFKRKDAEFDELMDVKIALDMEIMAYRLLLESEESRLGLKTPLKRRRVLDSPAPVPSIIPSSEEVPSYSPKTDEKDMSESESSRPTSESFRPTSESSRPIGRRGRRKQTSTPRRILTRSSSRVSSVDPVMETDNSEGAHDASGMFDLTVSGATESHSGSSSSSKFRMARWFITGSGVEGQYVTIRNGWPVDSSLLGYKMKSAKAGSIFLFPDLTVHAGETVTVRTVDSDTVTSREGIVLKWENGGSELFDPRGDEIQLIDPHDNVIATVDVIPPSIPGFGQAPPPRTEASVATGSDPQNCVVM